MLSAWPGAQSSLWAIVVIARSARRLDRSSLLFVIDLGPLSLITRRRARPPQSEPRAGGRGLSALRRRQDRRRRQEFHIAAPHNPDDPRKLIREGDRGFVVTAVRLDDERPLL